MKLPIKIILIEITVPILAGVASYLGYQRNLENFFGGYAAIAILIALLSFLIGIAFAISSLSKYQEWVIGLLVSGVILLITGFFAFTQVSFGR